MYTYFAYNYSAVYNNQASPKVSCSDSQSRPENIYSEVLNGKYVCFTLANCFYHQQVFLFIHNASTFCSVKNKLHNSFTQMLFYIYYNLAASRRTKGVHGRGPCEVQWCQGQITKAGQDPLKVDFLSK